MKFHFSPFFFLPSDNDWNFNYLNRERKSVTWSDRGRICPALPRIRMINRRRNHATMPSYPRFDSIPERKKRVHAISSKYTSSGRGLSRRRFPWELWVHPKSTTFTCHRAFPDGGIIFRAPFFRLKLAPQRRYPCGRCIRLGRQTSLPVFLKVPRSNFRVRWHDCVLYPKKKGKKITIKIKGKGKNSGLRWSPS